MLSEKMLFHFRKRAMPLCIALSVTLFSSPVAHSAQDRSYALEIQKYVAEDKVYLLENIQQNMTRPSEKTVVEALLCESGPQAIELFQKQLRDYPDPALDQLSTSRIAAYRVALDSTAPLPKLSPPLPSAKPQLASIPGKPKQDMAPIQSPLSEKPAVEAKPLTLPLAVRQKLESTPPPSPAKKRPEPEKTPILSALPEKPEQKSTSAGNAGYTLQFGLFANKENAVALTKKISLYEPAEIIVQGQFNRVILKKNYATKQEAGALMKKLPFESIIVQAK
jgi:cell division protein FtsN